MVKITNGTNVFEVSTGAFEGIYSKQGYYKVDDKKSIISEVSASPEKTEDELFIENIIEKPIGQWKKDEVKQFAELMEIDLTGTKNVEEARERIKEFLDAHGRE